MGALGSIRVGALEAGGTKMVCAVGDELGTIYERASFPTTTPEKTLPTLAAWFADKQITALGIGAFGPTGVTPDTKTFGKILDTPKLAWKGCNLRGFFIENLNCPVGYDTDVNAACLGEARFGESKGLANLVYVTIGTGIGAGVMIDHKLLHGTLHPEAGHMLLRRAKHDDAACTCPFHTDCLEGLASGPALEARWGAPAQELSDRAEVWELEANYLAQMCHNLVLVYAPERIILGGGVMHQTQLYARIRTKTLAHLHGYIKTPELLDIDTYIVAPSLHDNQGVLGCIALGLEALNATSPVGATP